jgi:trans-aconitate methyltransferase
MSTPPAGEPGAEERTQASAAGVYDWFLGGHHYLPVDREAAVYTQRTLPLFSVTVKHNRRLLQRMVRFLADQGVRQFVDVGSGYPTVGSVHEIAQQQAPESRVVYVDHNPDTVAVSRAILVDNPAAISIRGDLRDPDAILRHPEVTALLDFDEPVGLLLIAVLHFIPDREEPGQLVNRYLQHFAPGSYLAISHGVRPDDNHTRGMQAEAANVYNNTVREDVHVRTHDRIAAFFTGTELVPPGLVIGPDWRPDDPHHVTGEADEASAIFVGGVGRIG